MNVSPLDLRQQRFTHDSAASTRSRSRSFLTAVADDYEQALRETDRLRQDLARMEVGARRAPRAREEPSQSTLLTAQRLPTTSRRHAEDEARPHHPRGAGTLRPAAREDAGAARGHPARDRRPEAEAPRRRNLDRKRPSRRCATRSSSCASRTPASARRRSCSTARGYTDQRPPAAPRAGQRIAPLLTVRRGDQVARRVGRTRWRRRSSSMLNGHLILKRRHNPSDALLVTAADPPAPGDPPA